MSVAAMTMDDQRLNSYTKMPKQYEQTGGAGGFGGLSGPASPTLSDTPQYQQHHHLHTQIAEQPQQQQHQQQQQQQSSRQDHQQQQQQSLTAERMLEEEIENLKVEQARLLQQFTDSQRREKILTRRLTNKEQEFQDYVSQIAEFKAAQAPSAMALRSALLDPAVNLLFQKLKKELKATKAKLEETQNELSAWKFTPDSNTGKRLMAKCRLLYQENEELGKMTSSGRLAKLETELAMQKSFSEEVKKSQSELDDFLQELDEDVEGMQSTILFLQQELKTTQERIKVLEKENYQMKNGIVDSEILNLPKDSNNDETDNENNTLLHTGLNGNSTATAATIAENANINNDCHVQQHHEQQSLQLQQQHELKFQLNSKQNSLSSTLAPIEEEPCVRVSAYTCGGSVDYYNGNTDDQQQQQQHLSPTPASNSTNDDGAIGLVTGSRSLRTTVARKRAYESTESNEISAETNLTTNPLQITTPIQIAPAPTPTPTPRILPPKKSKLRMTPPTTQQDPMDNIENDIVTSSVIPPPATNNALITQDSATIIENATAATINEETIPAVPAPIATNDECGVAQRIMTRRRSMRTQQNGA